MIVQKRLLLIHDWWKPTRILIILAKARNSIVNDWFDEVDRILGGRLLLLELFDALFLLFGGCFERGEIYLLFCCFLLLFVFFNCRRLLLCVAVCFFD